MATILTARMEIGVLCKRVIQPLIGLDALILTKMDTPTLQQFGQQMTVPMRSLVTTHSGVILT